MTFPDIRNSNPNMECLFCEHSAQDHQIPEAHPCAHEGCTCVGFYPAFSADAEWWEWDESVSRLIA